VFHKILKIDEQAFMRATKATFKLGIAFEGWGQEGDKYIHSFGKMGKETWLCNFHHFWLRGLDLGIKSELGDYCVELQAAKNGKFATAPNSDINYAYHFDAGLYAKFLRTFSEGYGVTRIEGKIESVNQDAESGYIESLTLQSGRKIDGDLFIDCTGFRSLLIEQALGIGFEDWTHWLPCDRAVAVQTESTEPAIPMTRSIAHEAGWRWKIPLQHRVGNGMVYSSNYLPDDEATSQLLASIDGKLITEPRTIRFKTGRRRVGWHKNCVALGLASGFVEPLESTSIHLIMMGATRLMQLFPFNGIKQSIVDLYNEQTKLELERIRDFIVLHYHATRRGDSPFWQYCKSMDVPDFLKLRMSLFRDNGHVFEADGDLFQVDSWIQVMLGQHVTPEHYHHFTKMMPEKDLSSLFRNLKSKVDSTVAGMPNHQDFIDRYCRAESR
jgi:tryptophan halogenase